MSLVPKDEMTTLRSASDSRATAQSAEKDIQLQAIAYAINTAANTGLTETMFQSKLLDGVKDELEGKGYTVRFVDNNSYDREHHTLISWKENAVTQNAPSLNGPKYNTKPVEVEQVAEVEEPAGPTAEDDF